MTGEAKVSILKTILGIRDNSEDTLLGEYLALAKNEILNWKYSNVGGVPTIVTDVPAEDETTQIMAVVTGYNLRGAENQRSHNENGIIRSFKYADMVAYIRANVIHFIGTGELPIPVADKTELKLTVGDSGTVTIANSVGELEAATDSDCVTLSVELNVVTVTAVSAGTAKVTVTDKNGKTCSITVEVEA